MGSLLDVIDAATRVAKAASARVKIEFEEVYKEGGILGIGKESKKYEFRLNANDYIDDDLYTKDEEAIQRVLNEYLENMGLQS